MGLSVLNTWPELEEEQRKSQEMKTKPRPGPSQVKAGLFSKGSSCKKLQKTENVRLLEGDTNS